MSNFKINHSLLFRLSDFSRVRTQLTEDNERLEKTLLMEREQRIQTEGALAAVQSRLRSIEAGEEVRNLKH